MARAAVLASPTAISRPAAKAWAAAETAFYKVRKPTRRRRQRRRRSRAAAASREGGRRNRRGRVRTRPAHFRERRDSARGPGAVRGAGARERGLRPIKGRSPRPFLNVPRASRLSLFLFPCCASVSAPGHVMRFIHARLCSALSRVGRSRAEDFPPRCFSPAPLLPLALVYPSLASTSGPADCVPGARVYL